MNQKARRAATTQTEFIARSQEEGKGEGAFVDYKKSLGLTYVLLFSILMRMKKPRGRWA
jgi:hypothetical protein